MKIKYLFALLSASLLLAGCDQRHQTRHYRPLMAEKETVKVYKTHRTNSVPAAVLNGVTRVASTVADTSSDDNSWIYLYIIYDSTTRSYYSADSTTPVTSYSSLQWSKSSTEPEVEPTEEIQTAEVETSDLGEATAEISGDYSSIPEDNSLDSMEGVPDSSPSTEGGGGHASGGGGGGGDGGGGGE